MTAIIYEKLFQPYTSDGHTIENTLKYLASEAQARKISSEVMELAINEVFAEVANGKEFSKTKCHCGCGIDRAATDLIHTIRDKMFEIDNDLTIKAKDLLQERYRNFLAGEMKRISKTDKELIKISRPPLKERSPVLRGINKALDKLKNGN